MNDLKIIEMIQNFPIGEPAKNKAELLSKAEIVAFLSRFQEQFEMVQNFDERESMVRQYLEELLSLEEEENIPNLSGAERALHLSPGFIQDYNKVQLIKENDPAFTATYEMIADNLNLVNHQSKLM